MERNEPMYCELCGMASTFLTSVCPRQRYSGAVLCDSCIANQEGGDEIEDERDRIKTIRP